jgi:hypothetical protein
VLITPDTTSQSVPGVICAEWLVKSNMKDTKTLEQISAMMKGYKMRMAKIQERKLPKI